MSERLQVVLARVGLASRRGVVSLIESGKVTVNGVVVLEKGFRVDAQKDKITVDGAEIPSAEPQKKLTYIFNKPKNVMTTMQDPHAEHAVAEFFEDIPARLFPVGRLDRDTTGLLLMTNDGELAFRLTHPKFGVVKHYRAVVRGAVADTEIKKMESGVDLEGDQTAPCKITVESRDPAKTVLSIDLHEGKKRQIRRLFDQAGYRVLELERWGYGPLLLAELRPGQKRLLTVNEISQLRKAAGLK
ncbi:MAG: rRNA pseudouridine synthase [Candidatus Omnitrophica bacterium]|nr:rRNA pseudouridine synthase [Candidatus Omnitrophota bacterium]